MKTLTFRCKSAIIEPWTSNAMRIEATYPNELDVRDNFGIKEIISLYGEDEILDAIGEDRVSEYFKLIRIEQD